MIEGLGSFEDFRLMAEAVEDLFLGVALSSIRLFAAFNVLPATGQRFLQGLTRAGLVVMIGTYISFGVPVEALDALTPIQWFGHVLKEVLIGVLMGMAASTVFWTAECVGALVDTQVGYNNVQLTNPLSGEQSTPVSGMLLQLVLTVFYVLGGMLVFVGALFESFKVWPLLSPLPSLGGVSDVLLVGPLDTLMTSVVKFAAPLLLVLVLIDLGFGLVTRAADKLEPTSLSQPVKGAVTMLLLSLLCGVFITQVRSALLPTQLIQQLQALLPTS
ncbi:type III secretion system export apparatus subunit SctT [Caldimonas brevitalea]|uniref:Type III secretion system protein n=1 Tax=Caldimonas brevitalea TaxID=413882 RepID=A0A0G3BEV6_9BURK|nr:type III secretion system export apparatus subunit SctT [Caldimonas brevitalea]AKJ27822.1 type III secretion system protein [Caldimonas brevitalea]